MDHTRSRGAHRSKHADAIELGNEARAVYSGGISLLNGLGLGGIALNELLAQGSEPADHGVLGGTHFPPKAKRIIYLFMSGGPSHLDLFDYKPLLNKRNGEQLPDSVRGGQRLTGMSGNQSSIPLVGSPFKFAQYGQSGAWFWPRLPARSPGAADSRIARSTSTPSPTPTA